MTDSPLTAEGGKYSVRLDQTLYGGWCCGQKTAAMGKSPAVQLQTVEYRFMQPEHQDKSIRINTMTGGIAQENKNDFFPFYSGV